MALIPSYLRRPDALLLMPGAISRGLSATGFLRELQARGLGYRKTTFLADWRSQAGIEARKDVVKNIRKDRLPSTKTIADKEWEFHKGKQYMYRFGYWMPGEDLGEEAKHGINIMTDDIIKPQEAEALAWGKLRNIEEYGRVLPAKMSLYMIYHTTFKGISESEG